MISIVYTPNRLVLGRYLAFWGSEYAGKVVEQPNTQNLTKQMPLESLKICQINKVVQDFVHQQYQSL